MRPYVTSLLVSVCFVATAGARPQPAPAASPDAICAFRLVGLQALFAAANEVGLARQALAGPDPAPAADRLARALELLDAERERVAAEGGSYLGKKDRKTLAKALRAARRPTKKAARRAAREPAAAVEPLAATAGATIGELLAASSDLYGDLTCVGGELRIPHLHVPPGETRRVPGGSAIVAEDGIELFGSLVMAGTPADGLTLVAESGDVVLEGSIDARGTAPAPDALATLQTSARAALQPRGAEPPSCGDGGDFFITANTGNLRVGATFFALGGDGADCPPLEVSDAGQLQPNPGYAHVLHGRVGGNGGDMIVAAVAGSIRFAPRAPDDPGPFSPGSGGAGQDLTFSPGFVPPAGHPEFSLFGGRGGASGRLTLHGAEPGAAPLPRLYGISEGGRGGSLEWDQRAGEALFPHGLLELWVGGGFGGEGTVRGGLGGDVRYEGDRVVNAPGGPVTRLAALAGWGGGAYGDVPRGPDDPVLGGDGGDAEATGHAGWDGIVSHPDGAPGGEASVHGGIGTPSPLPDHPKSIGGRGGDARGYGGRGGNGRASCTDPPGPGGRGGEGGSVVVAGGDGGDAPGGRGGDGGSALVAETGSPGVGGEGDPPGECGLLAEDSDTLPGNGGEGFILGAQGEAVASRFTGCVGDDLAACDDDSDPGSCPRVYSSTVNVHTVYDFGREITSDYLDNGAQECTGDRCVWSRSGGGTTTTVEPNGETRTTSFSYADDYPDLPGGHGHNFSVHCSPSGELHLPGSGGVDRTERPGVEVTVTHSCDGCECIGTRPLATACCACGDCPGGWALCN
jgi:hypothetical protein